MRAVVIFVSDTNHAMMRFPIPHPRRFVMVISGCCPAKAPESRHRPPKDAVLKQKQSENVKEKIKDNQE
jgi:hypothetical protein